MKTLKEVVCDFKDDEEIFVWFNGKYSLVKEGNVVLPKDNENDEVMDVILRTSQELVEWLEDEAKELKADILWRWLPGSSKVRKESVKDIEAFICSIRK